MPAVKPFAYTFKQLVKESNFAAEMIRPNTAMPRACPAGCVSGAALEIDSLMI